MLLASFLLLLAAPQQTASAEAEAEAGDEIVVTGRRDYCTFTIDGKPVARGEIDRRAARWAAGQPLRVLVQDINDFRCLTKIAAQLSRRGARAFAFVGPEGQAAANPRSDLPQLRDPGEIRRHAAQRRAAELARTGQCDKAAQVLGDAGDIETALKLLPDCERR